MRKFFKRFFIVLLITLIVIQFFRPKKNISEGPFPHDISTKYEVPLAILNIFKVACYDCHSSNTRYPWYAELQPIAWWLDNHIKEGGGNLNFSEFTTYRIRKQLNRFKGIADLVKKDEMPLSSYTLLHKDARLSAEQKQLIEDWAGRMQDTIRAHYPPDSLLKK